MGRVYLVVSGGEVRVCRIEGMVGMEGEEAGGIEENVRLRGARDVGYWMLNESFTHVERIPDEKRKTTIGFFTKELCKYRISIR